MLVENSPTFAAESLDTNLPTIIPFKLLDNRVFLPVSINGHGPYAFILDTGAGDGSSVSLALYKLLGLPHESDDKIAGAGAASESVIKTHAGSIRVGPEELGPQPLMAFSLETMRRAIGFTKLDGILGDALFNRFVVTINFDRRKITLADPQRFRPPYGSTIVPFTIYNHIVPMYEGAVDGHKGMFLIDLGDRSSLTLFKPFWEKNGFDRGHGPVLEAMTGIGIGGPIHSFVTRVEVLKIGNTEVANPLTRLTLQKPSAIDDQKIAGSVGTGILKRFVVSFDYSNQRMILSPGAQRNQPDLYERAGLWIGRAPHRSLKVLDVTGGGPAEGAGIRLGDIIVSIDGSPAADIDLLALRESLKNTDRDHADIEIAREGIRSRKRIILRDLVPETLQ